MMILQLLNYFRSSGDYLQSLVFYEMARLNLIAIFQRFLDQNPMSSIRVNFSSLSLKKVCCIIL